jgi:hypothetical protein
MGEAGVARDGGRLGIRATGKRCGMVIGRASATGLSGHDERIRAAAAAAGEPPGQRRKDLRAAPPVGFQKSATGPGLGFYAARSYSLMRLPRTGRRLIRSWERSATGWSGRGGRRWRLR